MSKTKKKNMTINEMKSYIKDNIDGTNDKTITRIYEVMTGITASYKLNDGSIRLIT
jgi:hypothetical protein|tara:strand:+ start:10159 stop:10326 length:168 start_codon:yes stop_codon:yes gene_type:complete